MVSRAKPLLGTFVTIRVDGLPEARAHEAIDAAFVEIAQIHALMSFHDQESDVSRLNREAARRAIAVHLHTYAVLALAREMAELSGGCFDITVAPQLVKEGVLPAPLEAESADAKADADDVELLADYRVRFCKPLWIDLGGIAKGYAVDCGMAVLEKHGVRQGCINAGGDLRVIGSVPERVLLRVEGAALDALPVIELEAASLASSEKSAAHRDGRACTQQIAQRFVSVIAERCALADALTKPVMAMGAASDALLKHFGARAFLHEPAQGWVELGSASC